MVFSVIFIIKLIYIEFTIDLHGIFMAMFLAIMSGYFTHKLSDIFTYNFPDNIQNIFTYNLHGIYTGNCPEIF